MANTIGNFNPAYSTIKSIYLGNCAGISQSGSNQIKLDILTQNTECLFDKIELVENVNDVFPSCVLVVQDKKDIVSRIRLYDITKIQITFFDKSEIWNFDITGVSYLNNAASESEENFVGIYFTNEHYKKVQETSLSRQLGYKQPAVFRVKDLVKEIKTKCFSNASGYEDDASNYILYKPLNSIPTKEQLLSDNPIQYLNYVANYSVGIYETLNSKYLPNFLFWTGIDNSVNFKYFHRNLESDSTYPKINVSNRRVAVFDGESVIQKLSDGKIYRKAYAVLTNPAYQYISKNYYYISKTPKFLDNVPVEYWSQSTPSGITYQNYTTKALTYQFQDEGQKYNIKLISSSGLTFAIPGAEQIIDQNSWGFYDELNPVTENVFSTNIIQNYGLESEYSRVNFMGATGYMPYVDTPDMWQNMFDITEIHPNYPDNYNDVTSYPEGNVTNLQKVMNVRFATFQNNLVNSENRVEQLRQIELQNFVMYSLCCMGIKDEEESFFAELDVYEEDNDITVNQPTDPVIKKWRYRWKELKFDGIYGETGPDPSSYAIHNIEEWETGDTVASTTQDDTWAINLNERKFFNLLPSFKRYNPGYYAENLPTNYRMRPIGIDALSNVEESGSVSQVVRMFKLPFRTFLQESGQSDLIQYYEGKYLYFFWAENVLDGPCD